jgi:uncharacterized protein YecE (DUF72 family)
LTVRVGTSGFDYRHWRGVLYPPQEPHRRWLELYAAAFDTVELNSTFYRLPPTSRFRAWGESVPPGFTFAVKASRYLTHVRRLQGPREPVERLMSRAAALGDALGPILLQLPPDMAATLDRLDATLRAFGPGVRVAVEPRHPSWFTDELRTLLEEHRAALCLVDRGGPKGPGWLTADWSYARLHAGRAAPPSCYGRAAVATWARRLSDGPSPSYVYFNNDGHGCAVRNAKQLLRLLRSPAASPTRSQHNGR